MKASANTNVGKVRDNNEDNFHCSLEERLFIVADGLGGHSAGEVASEMAVKHVVQGKPENTLELSILIEEANKQVNSKAVENKNDMATTISTLIVRGNKGYIGHVGDSRIYLIRGEEIMRVTIDHTPVTEYLREGLITQEQANKHPMRHMLSRTIGSHQEVEVDSNTIDVQAEDMFVLCTDGLCNLLEDEEIYNVVMNNVVIEGNSLNVDKIANILIDEALDRGGIDNVTVVVVYVDEKDLSN